MSQLPEDIDAVSLKVLLNKIRNMDGLQPTDHLWLSVMINQVETLEHLVSEGNKVLRKLDLPTDKGGYKFRPGVLYRRAGERLKEIDEEWEWVFQPLDGARISAYQLLAGALGLGPGPQLNFCVWVRKAIQEAEDVWTRVLYRAERWEAQEPSGLSECSNAYTPTP